MIKPVRTVRILDVGSGGGDMALRLTHLAENAGVSLRICGCDISPTAVALANERAAAARSSSVVFHQCDVLCNEFPEVRYDMVLCSTFLHHFSSKQAIHLLRRMAFAAERLVVIDDLRRSVLGFWLARTGCRLLSGNRIVHVDGPRSVEGAFTGEEAKALALEAGLKHVVVQYHWPQRYLLAARPDSGAAYEQC